MNLAEKRNIKRFTKNFMFHLKKKEFESLRFQIETSNNRGESRYLPYAFTEQGDATLSGILHSDKAIKMNVAIMRAPVEIRRIAIKQIALNEQWEELRERVTEHDVQRSQIYDAIENLHDKKAVQKPWKDRERMGFENYFIGNNNLSKSAYSMRSHFLSASQPTILT